jgi:hypothetical protein
MLLHTHYVYLVALAAAYASQSVVLFTAEYLLTRSTTAGSIMAKNVKDCARSYIVQQSDTCNSIGAANNAST